MYYIYKITCISNGKIYIGQTTNIKDRMRDHFGKLQRGEHHNPYIQKDYNLYGKINFVYEIINICNNKEESLNCETDYIEKYGGIESDAVYNCKNKYHNNSNMILILKNTAKMSPNYGMKGKHLSEEQKKHLAEIHTGKKLSKSTCVKISNANKKYTDADIQMFREEYNMLGSYQAVADLHNLNRCVISRLCRYGSANCEKIYKESVTTNRDECSGVQIK